MPTSSAVQREKLSAQTRARLLPLSVFVSLALILLLIAPRVAFTFIDEVYFLESAVNLLRGEGFKMAAWNLDISAHPYVSTAPAYVCLLAAWVKAFGLTQFAVRSLSVLSALAAVGVLERACRRFGWLKDPASRVWLIAIVLLDYGLAFSYTTGRPDALSFLALTSLLWLASFPDRGWPLWAMGAIGAALPFLQYGAVVYAGLLGGALFVLFSRKTLKRLLVVAVAIALGLLIQRLLYQSLGIWDAWVMMIRSEGSTNMAQRILSRLSPSALRHHSNTVPKDLTTLVLFVGIGIGYAQSRLSGDRFGAWLGKAAGVIVLAVVLGMYLVAKAPTYYSWMTCAPLAVILCAYHERAAAARWRFGRLPLTAVCAAACLSGFPLLLAVAAHDWKERQPATIDRWVESQITQEDVVYCDYPFYYPAKRIAKRVYAGYYIQKMTPEEARQVTVAIIGNEASDYQAGKLHLARSESANRWTAGRNSLLGNAWKYGFLSPPNDSGTLYRLKPEPASP